MCIVGLGMDGLYLDGLDIAAVRLDRRRQGTTPAVVVGTRTDTYADTAAC